MICRLCGLERGSVWVEEVCTPCREASREKLIPAKISLCCERGSTGLWFITSDAHRGFMCSGQSLTEALSKVPLAIDEILNAQREADIVKDAAP